MDEMLYYDLKETQGVAPGLAKQICREIGRRIVSGLMREGGPVDDEGKLCAQFSVSRPVIREAVKMLSGKGLVEVRRGDGTRVLPRVNWNLLDDDVLAWHLSVAPRPDFLMHLLEVRRMIEPPAAAWAAERADDSQIARIGESLQQMERAEDPHDFAVADARFHRAILRATGNEVLRSMEGVIFSALLSSIRLTNTNPIYNEQSIPFHRRVLDAIEARSPETASEAMMEHLADTDARLFRAMEHGALAQTIAKGENPE